MNKYILPVSSNIEVPCKNNLLNVAQASQIELSDNLLVRAEKIGKFYYSVDSDGPLFKDCHFEANPDYNGNFELEAPLKLFWEIIGRCNLKCKGCYIPGNKQSDHDIEKLKLMVDNASESGVIGIQLLGGEPTLLKALPELAAYIKEKEMRVEIVTNGFNMDEALIESLEDVVDYCAISIDGNEDTHNEYRGNKNSFSKAINAFELLKESKISTEILMTVNKKNLEQIDAVFEAAGSDPDKFYLKILHPSSEMIKDNSDIYLSNEEKMYVRKKAEELGVPYQLPSTHFQESGDSTFFGCPGGVLTGVIAHNGDVFKCLYSRKKVMGNVYTDSIKDIWNKNNLLLKEVMGDKCLNCDKKSQCGGFCDISSDRDRFYLNIENNE